MSAVVTLVAMALALTAISVGAYRLGFTDGWVTGRREEREAARIREDLETWPGPDQPSRAAASE